MGDSLGTPAVVVPFAAVKSGLLSGLFTSTSRIPNHNLLLSSYLFALIQAYLFSGSKMPLSCRFYKQKYPEVEDVVMVNVRSIAEMGAYVHLLEYNNIEGMILLSELSRRRIRSINKLIRVGKTEPVVVIRVDKEKGRFCM